MRRKKKRLQPRCIQDSLWLELCRSFWSTKVKRYHLTRQRQEMLQSSAVTWWVSRVSRVFVFFVGGGGREILYIFFCLRVAVFIFVFWICKFSGFLFFVLILHIYIYIHIIFQVFQLFYLLGSFVLILQGLCLSQWKDVFFFFQHQRFSARIYPSWFLRWVGRSCTGAVEIWKSQYVHHQSLHLGICFANDDFQVRNFFFSWIPFWLLEVIRWSIWNSTSGIWCGVLRSRGKMWDHRVWIEVFLFFSKILFVVSEVLFTEFCMFFESIVWK